MAFIEINGARLYYETYGQDHPARAPIVLIHGSTLTGQADWSHIAPLLAREYLVVVPDCRGHGQSSNPAGSYSFREMAADIAALIRALGYARAHVIGHSNGGNVALVTLLEHPEVVQTCIPQAANAYVSDDLLQREPPLFDPERVEREAPDWRDRMIALHGPTHGPDYWRDLLRLTLQETISPPAYTPADLARVTRPTLVIQGENDPVNAPAGHGQFIARHIPAAERWIPAGVAHNVHLEIPCAWLERVLDFLARRGDDANDALYRLQRIRYADARETVFEVRAERTEDGGEGTEVALTGSVLLAEQHQAALAVLPSTPLRDGVRVLLDDAPWALVKRAAADVNRQPRPLAERMTQALIGEAVRILEERGDWLRVHLERDGYLGWMRGYTLHRCDEQEVQDYLASCDTLILAELAQGYEGTEGAEEQGSGGAEEQRSEGTEEQRSEGAEDRQSEMVNRESGVLASWRLGVSTSGGRQSPIPRAGKLPFGATLPAIDRQDGFAALRLPDDRLWWVAESDLLPVAQRPKADAAGIAFTLDLIRRFLGIPYLWGGRSPFGYDCSGLAQTFWGVMGVQIPRDADQQFRFCAEETEARGDAETRGQGERRRIIGNRKSEIGNLRPGDLLFFGEPVEEDDDRYAHISHVAISLGGQEFIHANVAAGGVSCNSFDPANPAFSPWLREHLVGVGAPLREG